MNRIDQWLCRREGSQRSQTEEHGSRRTIRTVETVERQQKTFLIESLQSGALDACPLCGHKLGSPVDDSTHPRLLE
jgi:hypothetical protein